MQEKKIVRHDGLCGNRLENSSTFCSCLSISVITTVLLYIILNTELIHRLVGMLLSTSSMQSLLAQILLPRSYKF